MLPSPPSNSPTNTAREADFWYPDYESGAWNVATCLNDLPLPFGKNDRPTYTSKAACCSGAYAGQVSKTCICSLDDPPAGCPAKVVRNIKVFPRQEIFHLKKLIILNSNCHLLLGLFYHHRNQHLPQLQHQHLLSLHSRREMPGTKSLQQPRLPHSHLPSR
ncbi:hypothetical protein ACHAXR_000115 [Thalassiosira sp. AJA248-18]